MLRRTKPILLSVVLVTCSLALTNCPVLPPIQGPGEGIDLSEYLPLNPGTEWTYAVLGTEDQYKLNVVEKVVQEAATKAYGPDDAWKITWTLNDGEAQTSYLVMHEEREIRDADNFRVNPLALYEVSEADFLESGMDAAGNLGATRWESAEMLQRYFHKYYWYYESGAAADLLAGWLPARKAPELIELGAAYQGLADAVRTDWGPYLWSDIYQNDDVLIPASRKRAWCLYGKDIGMLVLERGGDMLVLQDHTAP